MYFLKKVMHSLSYELWSTFRGSRESPEAFLIRLWRFLVTILTKVWRRFWGKSWQKCVNSFHRPTWLPIAPRGPLSPHVAPYRPTRFLARRTDAKFNKTIYKRLNMTGRSRCPVSLSKLAKNMEAKYFLLKYIFFIIFTKFSSNFPQNMHQSLSYSSWNRLQLVSRASRRTP